MGMPSIPSGARMPIPGNAEFALWVFIEIVFVIIWIAAKSVDTRMWTILTTILVSFYFLSRGIAKASRVLEQ
jgi:nicotinamide riboside transporter PnuC